ncbi:unnamed protein product [Rhizoctonia solani]|uniref:DUF202 domain-containing protein n=1 Tax=Rhizoctonia solani TaxID=456999 RepID=A0A8H3HE86_9AGAM|nr:unnamed protein product [Rhizoctonia solani]CAE6530662.1 unnamed protein product [Rhizoctonia solani]
MLPIPGNKSEPVHRYRGHRRESFCPLDVSEMVELRARGRTFYGAYARTALGNLGYSAVVLKLFDKRFYRIGLLYVILAVLLFIVSIVRRKHSRHDFSDLHASHGRFDGHHAPESEGGPNPSPRKRIFGRPFVTAGWVVVFLTSVVAIIEIALLIFLLQI